MDSYIRRQIREFLAVHPGSSARQIKVGIGASKKTEVNSCLYSFIGDEFQKRGESPPLWWNVGDHTSLQEVNELNLTSGDVDIDVQVENEVDIRQIVETEVDESVDEGGYPKVSETNSLKRFTICGKCGQLIGSKGNCGC